MGRRSIRIVADAGELARAGAAEFIRAATRSIEERGSFAVALAGGSTPRALYQILAEGGSAVACTDSAGAQGGGTRTGNAGPAQPAVGRASEQDSSSLAARRISWNAVQFFWGDERTVPPDHPESNYRMAREALLSKIGARASNVHRIRGEDPDPARAAEEYERVIRERLGDPRGEARAGAPRGAEGEGGGRPVDAPPPTRPGLSSESRAAERAGPPTGRAAPSAGGDRPPLGREAAPSRGAVPRFDLVLLGMGPDGHTASLFPGTDVVHETRRLVAAVRVEKLATWRVTLTPVALNAASRVVFLVSGAEKAAAFREVLEGEYRPDLFPAQIVRPVDGSSLWLVDSEAAALLSLRGRAGSEREI